MGRICMFTGHRVVAAEHMPVLINKIDELLERLIDEGYTEFRTGGALGFDTLVSLRVIEKKEKYGNIKLCLYLPCKNHDIKWNRNEKKAYAYIASKADSICHAYEHYVNGCMQTRNRALVDGSELCIAYCGKDTGGTAYTVRYAAKKGLEIINTY